MKKINCTEHTLSQSRESENFPVLSDSCQKEVENRLTGSEIMPNMRKNESLASSHTNYSDDNITGCVMNNKKKEKFGIFSNLRRRFRSNFIRKNNETDKNIEENEPSEIVVKSKSDSKRHKQSAKCRLNLCSKPSNSNSSQSNESLDLNFQIHRKLDENLWSNKDRKEDGSRKEKASCKSKDISKFQTNCRISCACEGNRNRGAENSDCKDCMKITNVSPSFPSTRLEISVLCHSNGINSNSSIHYHHDYKSSISDGAIFDEVPKVWSLTHELFRLSKFGWYWGPITRREAERKLNGQPDGAFLVRDSSDERYLLSLSFRSYGKTLHTRIEHCNGKFIFDAQPDTEGYPSIVDLIENSMNDPQTGICSYSRRGSPSPPIYPVRLTKPVSRFTQVRSLQYMCRFVIRQYTRYDHIQQLPLPKKLKGWIGENQY